MKQFKRTGHEGIKFFIGPEVEQTPAFNKKTLFVVGLQDTPLIEKLATEHNIKHIYLGANRSFDSVEKIDDHYMVGAFFATDWEKQIHNLLDKGFMVSLDYPAHKHVMVLNILSSAIWQSRNFVPILSVPVPHVNTSNVNLTIKIDDVSFGETNPGVWCLNHHEITDSNRFTGWAEYGDDVFIEIDKEAAFPDRKVFFVDVGDIDADQAQEVVIDAIKNAKLNQAELGLDPVAKSALKADPDALAGSEALAAVMPTTPTEAADAYAEGSTVDPLSEKESKKPAAAKPATAKPAAKPATAKPAPKAK